MPRYFFHVFDDRDFLKDEVGMELSGLVEARQELQRVTRIMPESLRRPGTRAAVHNETGEMLDEMWVAPFKKT
jgi:hypothetical protein